jgi:ppGpp synthetase/RelA/SpoT-type nucleotidyltranferase
MMSKSQINKLGREIRLKLRDNIALLDDELSGLQEYRISFKEDLSDVFRLIATLSSQGRKDNIVSFRIKRIESILSKIKREPTMSLGNMGDIAGCRVIVYSLTELNNLVGSINKNFTINNFNDYVTTPKDDGYNGYHFYVRSPRNEHKLIEIQIRLISTHKWASLVEILDILYDLKLKEGQENKELQDFIKILSINKNEISLDQKKRVIELDNKFKIYSRLNEVFLKNHISIRLKWLEICNVINNHYFIFDVNEDKKSNILSYDDYTLAEDKYFDMFKTNKNSNFVLAYIEKPNFKKICIAYSSYMLIKHDYLEEYWNLFAKEIISLEDVRGLTIYKDYIQRNLEDVNSQLGKEIEEIDNYLKTHENDVNNVRGIQEWVDELKTMNNLFQERNNEIKELFNSNKAKNIWRRIFK